MRFFSPRIALILVFASALCACASGYKQFYVPADGATPEAIAALRTGPAPAMPAIERSAPGNPDEIIVAYARRGFVMIGHSSFNSGQNESESSALDQGKTVGADLVLVINPQYTGSVTTSVPLTTPTNNTAYTSGTATAYGPAGTVTAYGSATTTVHGTTTTYIPMTVHRSDYTAVFFVKQRFNLGAFVRNLEDAERQALQTNQGVVVLTVVDNTPAFYSDILAGDMIMTIDGVTVTTQELFIQILESRRGSQVRIMLKRNGQKIEKLVQLNR